MKRYSIIDMDFEAGRRRRRIVERHKVLHDMETAMFLPVMLDKGAKMPTRAHDTDAGLDLYMPDIADETLFAHDTLVIDTGVHVLIPDGYVGMIKSKSGLNVKYGITSEGVIDAGYTGSIVVKLYNHSDDDIAVDCGDKISQLVILPIITPTVKLVNEFPVTDRGDNGFGSTGR